MRIYNYLTREIEEFRPLHEGFVGMYVCGPTVYGDAHLGHAKAYITFDVLRRYLEHKGFRVRYVQNITDVGHLVGDADEGEDKIGKQARLERVEPMEVVETYTRNYFRDMDALNVRRPNISPRASGHVPEQIELAQTLIDKGIAYATEEGNVYFSVPSWPRYGTLSRKDVDQLSEGARIEVSSDKRDPRDFAVWRAATPEHLMKWNSPFGVGFPGWHAECTVMARKYLGLPFDIHGGGLENIFPHNESEMAQAEAAYGQGFARYWVLNNMVTVEGRKMGKSLGNAISLSQLFSGNHRLLKRGYPPMVVRFFVLGSHYRQNTDFSDEPLNAAQNGYDRLLSAISLVDHAISQAHEASPTASSPDVARVIDAYTGRFTEAMDSDLNTPQALAVLFDFARETNALINSGQRLSKGDLERLRGFYQVHAGDVLGLLGSESGSGAPLEPQKEGLADDLMKLILEMRAGARAKKDYETADQIRKRLAAIGVELEDRKDGTVWRVKR